MLAWIRCVLRDRHQPKRYFLGGFKCADCGALGADLDDMGFRGDSYVNVDRRAYLRAS
jgi:hypothetical protein